MYTSARNTHFNRTRLILTYIGFVLIYYMWFQAFYNLMVHNRLFNYDSSSEAVVEITKNCLSISSVFVVNTLIIFRLNRWAKGAVKILYDTIFSICAAIVVSLLARVVIVGVGVAPDYDWSGIVLNDVIILLINEVGYFFYIHYTSLQKAEEAERTALLLQYDVLKSQVNPHFLFNSLNILYSMSAIDTAKTREFILSLSQMYRYILSQHDKHSVPLSEELNFLNSYMDVLKMRYHNCLFFNLTGIENVGSHEVIPYCTQLLIENVTKHNTIQTEQPMTVDINILPDEITISNPIHPKKVSGSSRIGLNYVSELYAANGKKFYYTNDGTTFTTHIPYLR